MIVPPGIFQSDSKNIILYHLYAFLFKICTYSILMSRSVVLEWSLIADSLLLGVPSCVYSHASSRIFLFLQRE